MWGICRRRLLWWQVAWDRTGKAEATVQRVSPWEMELDPAEQARRDAEAARLEELAARQARAEAKRLRCCNGH
jgi:hypothetical protein